MLHGITGVIRISESTRLLILPQNTSSSNAGLEVGTVSTRRLSLPLVRERRLITETIAIMVCMDTILYDLISCVLAEHYCTAVFIIGGAALLYRLGLGNGDKGEAITTQRATHLKTAAASRTTKHEEHGSSNNVSETFRRARARGVPKLIFIMDANVVAAAAQVITAAFSLTDLLETRSLLQLNVSIAVQYACEANGTRSVEIIRALGIDTRM